MSTIDLQSIVDQIYNSFKQDVLTAVTNDLPAIVTVATGYVANEEKTLKDLATGALSGDLAWDFVVRRLKEIETDLIDSLISIEQIVASDIQTLVDNLITLFENLLKTAVLSINPTT
jgi:hypothetical protein